MTRDVWHYDAGQFFSFDGVKAELCPWWYVTNHRPWVNELVEVTDAEVMLTLEAPAPLVESSALLKRTRAARNEAEMDAARSKRDS